MLMRANNSHTLKSLSSYAFVDIGFYYPHPYMWIGCNRTKPSRALGFQDWLIYEDAYSIRARTQARVH
jgi:hypothetical protein